MKCFLEAREIDRARDLVETMIAVDGETPNILLKKASVLGLRAQYQEASEILLRLNRDFPGRPAILRRLVVVFEQLREWAIHFPLVGTRCSWRDAGKGREMYRAPPRYSGNESEVDSPLAGYWKGLFRF